MARIRTIKRWNGAEWVTYELGMKKADILGHIAENDTGFVEGGEIYTYVEAVKTDLNTQIQNIIGGEGLDQALDTIKEIQDWINTHGEDAADLVAALNQEITDRTNGDTALQNALNAEITARGEADTALQTAIDNEATRATTKEGELLAALNKLIEDISWHVVASSAE